ncbi:hypothetical protein KIPB_010006, partial [Kipferlia bialata]
IHESVEQYVALESETKGIVDNSVREQMAMEEAFHRDVERDEAACTRLSELDVRLEDLTRQRQAVLSELDSVRRDRERDEEVLVAMGGGTLDTLQCELHRTLTSHAGHMKRLHDQIHSIDQSIKTMAQSEAEAKERQRVAKERVERAASINASAVEQMAILGDKLRDTERGLRDTAVNVGRLKATMSPERERKRYSVSEDAIHRRGEAALREQQMRRQAQTDQHNAALATVRAGRQQERRMLQRRLAQVAMQ